MPTLKKEATVNYTLQQVYSIVQDVESYPKFVPWCTDAKIIEKLDDVNFNAELLINFAGFRNSYISKVTLYPPDDRYAKVDAKMISGPFRHLFTSWQLSSIDANSVKVIYFIDFSFSSPFLEKIAGGFLSSAYSKIMPSFQKRAEILFS